MPFTQDWLKKLLKKIDLKGTLYKWYTTIGISQNNTMKIVNKFIASLNKDVEYHVGENEDDNFHIIDIASQDDIWFHIDGYSCGHIIAKIDGLKLDKKNLRQIITQGCLLCKEVSRYTHIKDIGILYTRIQNVAKTETIGKVTLAKANVRII
jgi:predicted ribosome quality control (RQC) complex YloA/Tae2 family protein